MRQTYYAVDLEQSIGYLGSLIDMMRYDGSEIVGFDDKRLTLLTEYSVTVERWRSFGIAVYKEGRYFSEVFVRSKRPNKGEIFFLINQHQFTELGQTRFALRAAKWEGSEEQKKLIELILLLKTTRAIPCSNSPSGFQLFRSCINVSAFQAEWECWSKIGVPIHYAIVGADHYPPYELHDAAKRPPIDSHVVIPAKKFR
jgi:hypothetical protein